MRAFADIDAIRYATAAADTMIFVTVATNDACCYAAAIFTPLSPLMMPTPTLSQMLLIFADDATFFRHFDAFTLMIRQLRFATP